MSGRRGLISAPVLADGAIPDPSSVNQVFYSADGSATSWNSSPTLVALTATTVTATNATVTTATVGTVQAAASADVVIKSVSGKSTKIKNAAGTVLFECTDAGNTAVNGNTPAAKAAAITAVPARTDSTGGSSSGALVDPTKVNSNIARLAADIVLLRAQVDALTLAIKNFGITS